MPGTDPTLAADDEPRLNCGESRSAAIEDDAGKEMGNPAIKVGGEKVKSNRSEPCGAELPIKNSWGVRNQTPLISRALRLRAEKNEPNRQRLTGDGRTNRGQPNEEEANCIGVR